MSFSIKRADSIPTNVYVTKKSEEISRKRNSSDMIILGNSLNNNFRSYGVDVYLSAEGLKKTRNLYNQEIDKSKEINDEKVSDSKVGTEESWRLSYRNQLFIDDAMRMYDPEAFNEMVERIDKIKNDDEFRREKGLEYLRSIYNWWKDKYKLYDNYHTTRYGATAYNVEDLSYKCPLYNDENFAYNAKTDDFDRQLKNCLSYDNRHNVFMQADNLQTYFNSTDEEYSNKVTTLLSDSYEKIKEYDEKGVKHGNIGFLIEGASIKEVYALNGDKIIRGTDIDDLFSNLSKTE